jgi:hypothetical protein
MPVSFPRNRNRKSRIARGSPNGKLRIRSRLTSPISIGQGETEKSSAMMRTKQIPVSR